MGRNRKKQTGILFLLALGLLAGCSARGTLDIDDYKTTNLLFGPDRSTLLATQIGRSLWPATEGRYESIQDTIFVEYYRDYQGDAFLERSNPRRVFRSYRVGTQHR